MKNFVLLFFSAGGGRIQRTKTVKTVSFPLVENTRPLSLCLETWLFCLVSWPLCFVLSEKKSTKTILSSFLNCFSVCILHECTTRWNPPKNEGLMLLEKDEFYWREQEMNWHAPVTLQDPKPWRTRAKEPGRLKLNFPRHRVNFMLKGSQGAVRWHAVGPWSFRTVQEEQQANTSPPVQATNFQLHTSQDGGADGRRQWGWSQ